MKRILVPAVLLMSLAAAPKTRAGAALHFDLSKSTPAADATVHAVPEVRLWFTGAPESGTTSIRVISTGDTVLPTGEVVQDPTDGRVVSVALTSAPAPGPYTVAWRAMGDDGHVVRGEFKFSVAAH